MVAGEEQHDQLRRGLELTPILFARQLPDMFADLLAVPLERSAARRLVGGGGSIEISRERNLGIDHQTTVIREPHDHIRANSNAVTFLSGLLEEIAVLDHA